MRASSLAGCRVIEMGSYVASPFAGHLLKSLGAEVIKVESSEGDPTRHLYRGGPGGTFIAYSHGKRSVCIDLTTAGGQRVFDRLLQSSHVLLHNLAPESAQKLHITPDRCLSVNPDLVFCRITGYGPGPRQEDKATNPLIEAATGVMFQNRVDGRPTRLGPSYIDMFAGCSAVIGILAALIAPNSAHSRVLEVPLYETGLYVAARDLVAGQLEAAAVARGLPPAKSPEFGHPGYAAYETSDGRWIYLLMLTDAHWRKFCACLNLPWDEALVTLDARKANFSHVDSVIAGAIGKHAFDDIAATLAASQFAFAEVHRPSAVLRDPQARQSGKSVLLQVHETPVEVPTFPVSLESATPTSDPAQATSLPSLGQHTAELLSSLGFSLAEFQALESEGAIRTASD